MEAKSRCGQIKKEETHVVKEEPLDMQDARDHWRFKSGTEDLKQEPDCKDEREITFSQIGLCSLQDLNLSSEVLRSRILETSVEGLIAGVGRRLPPHAIEDVAPGLSRTVSALITQPLGLEGISSNGPSMDQGSTPPVAQRPDEEEGSLPPKRKSPEDRRARKRFSCVHCTKPFSDSYHLRRHLRTHTGERPHQCPECRKRFSDASYLKTHLRIHSGEKPFACTLCAKRFYDSSNLKLHARIHSGERAFACTLCAKTFNRLDTLRIHLRIHARRKQPPPLLLHGDKRRFEIGQLDNHLVQRLPKQQQGQTPPQEYVVIQQQPQNLFILKQQQQRQLLPQ